MFGLVVYLDPVRFRVHIHRSKFKVTGKLTKGKIFLAEK